MEGDFHRTGKLDQRPSSLDVDVAVWSEESEDDTVDSSLLGEGDVVLHDCQFFAGVEEVAGAGTDDDMDTDFEAGSDFADQAHARGQAAFDEGAAEFDTLGSTGFGGYGRFY